VPATRLLSGKAFEPSGLPGSGLKESPNVQFMILAIPAEVSKTHHSGFWEGSNRVNPVKGGWLNQTRGWLSQIYHNLLPTAPSCHESQTTCPGVCLAPAKTLKPERTLDV